jgi:Family of unknown function (DUF6167)
VRTVWFLAGGAAGAYATSKVRRLAEALSYDGVHDRLSGWFAGARIVREELRAGIAEKEAELLERVALGADAATVLALPTGSPDGSPDSTGGSADNPPDESRDDH